MIRCRNRCAKLILEKFNLIAVIALFLWLSFFPAPIHAKYHIAVRVFLAFSFLALLIQKRWAIFRKDDIFLWAFLAATGINIIFAQKMDVALRTWLDLIIPMLFVYYLAAEVFFRETDFKILTKVICISSILVALGGVGEFLFHFNPLYEYLVENSFYKRYIGGIVRPMSTQYNPAVLGSYMLACLPFNFLLFKQEKGFFKYSGIAGMVLGTVIIILTFSRGVFLGLIGMLIFYFFAQKKYSKVIIVAIGIFALVLICTNLPYPLNRFGADRLIRSGDGILSAYRFDRCITAGRIARDYPLTGLGFQHFRLRFHEYFPGEYRVGYEFRIADNMYLTLLAETGILGLLGFLVLLLFLFRKGWARLRSLNDAPQRRLQLLVVLCAFTGLLINMGAYELFYWPNMLLYFCIIVGFIRAFDREPVGDETTRLSSGSLPYWAGS